MTKRDQNNPLDAEHAAEMQAEGFDPKHLDEADTEEVTAALFEHGAQADQVEGAEEAAIHTDTETAKEASGEGEKPKKVSKAVATKPKQLSKKYQEAQAKVDPKKRYGLEAAITLVQDSSYVSFDGTVEFHCHMKVKKAKADQADRFRLMAMLPHGTGKEASVAVLDEAMIDHIKKTGEVAYELYLATPALMPKVAQIAKILGPKGKMPNPKTGTVTDNPDQAKQAISSGRVEVRADSTNNIHQAIGRVSWPVEKLVENLRALLAVLPATRLQSAHLSATMGPSIQLDLTK